MFVNSGAPRHTCIDNHSLVVERERGLGVRGAVGTVKDGWQLGIDAADVEFRVASRVGRAVVGGEDDERIVAQAVLVEALEDRSASSEDWSVAVTPFTLGISGQSPCNPHRRDRTSPCRTSPLPLRNTLL